jgi:hypothetical protein
MVTALDPGEVVRWVGWIELPPPTSHSFIVTCEQD